LLFVLVDLPFATAIALFARVGYNGFKTECVSDTGKESMTDKNSLRTKQLFIFDLDGTLYLDGVLFPKSLELLAEIRRLGGQVVFLTNNSSISTARYVEKIRNLGIPCERKEVATSTEATIAHIQKHHPGKRFYVMGTQSMKTEFMEAGIRFTDQVEEDVDGVVIGYDTELTYQKLIDATKLLNRGVAYLATNPDKVCPVAYGYVPDCGSFAMMLEQATGRTPLFLGKPNAAILEMVLERTKIRKEQAVLIGDRLYTDILCGIHAGIDTVLVLSGETKRADLEVSLHQPTFVMDGVHSILNLLKQT
jgi:HAD superfamily hydrolase (TIGR01450 family)